jgi:hypothetical protein
MTADAFQPIYDELVAKHGCTTVSDKALARSLAKALIAEDVNPALVERLTALLPKPEAVAGPQALTVEFVDPRLSRLDDSQLAALEEIVRVMNNAPPEEREPTVEEKAFAALQKDRDYFRERALWLEAQWSASVREVEQLSRAAKAAAQIPPVQNAPTGVSEKTATPPGGKVVSFADWNGQVVDRSAPGVDRA